MSRVVEFDDLNLDAYEIIFNNTVKDLVETKGYAFTGIPNFYSDVLMFSISFDEMGQYPKCPEGFEIDFIDTELHEICFITGMPERDYLFDYNMLNLLSTLVKWSIEEVEEHS